MEDQQTQETVPLQSQIQKNLNLELYDTNAQLADDPQHAVTARLIHQNSTVYMFEIIDLNGDKAGRLISMTDTQGYGIHITYKSWTPQELIESPERQW